MTSILKTAAIKCFETCLAASGGGVDVVNGSHETKGIRKVNSEVSFTREMDVPVSGHVRVLIDEIGDVQEDGEITVDGKRVFISSTDPDVAGAIMRIDYTESRSVPEEFE
jgi:hypothetical protein